MLLALRRQSAIVSASRVNSSFIRLLIDQTTMFRANRSITTAMNNHLVDGFSLKVICVTRALSHLVPLVINYDFSTKSVGNSQAASLELRPSITSGRLMQMSRSCFSSLLFEAET